MNVNVRELDPTKAYLVEVDIAGRDLAETARFMNDIKKIFSDIGVDKIVIVPYPHVKVEEQESNLDEHEE